MPYVYILELSNGAYYTGSTMNLEIRLTQHAEGSGANFTRKHLPFALVYCQEVGEVATAFAWEKQIQGWSRAKKRALIDGRMDELPALSRNRAVDR